MSVVVVILLSKMSVLAEHDSSGDPLQWLRDSVPGEPGLDYPILSSPDQVDTSFSCQVTLHYRNFRRHKRHFLLLDFTQFLFQGLVTGGYYADVDAQCQVFHVCLGSQQDKRVSFLCPNGTIFAQASESTVIHLLTLFLWRTSLYVIGGSMLTVPPLLVTMTMLALPSEHLMTMVVVNVQPNWAHVSNQQ